MSSLAALTGVSLAAATLWAGPAQPPAAEPAAPARSAILTLELANFDQIFVDAKDQRLKRALLMLPARLKELPGDLPKMARGDGPPEELLDLVGRLIGKGLRLGIEYDMKRQDENNRFGVGVQWSLATKDKGEAEAVDRLVRQILQKAPEELKIEPSAEPAFKGLSSVVTPGGVARFGPRERDGAWGFDVAFGPVSDPSKLFTGLRPMTPSVGGRGTVYAHLTLDFSSLTPLAQMMATMMGGGRPEINQVLEGLRAGGLLGENAMQIEAWMGYTEQGSFSYTMQKGAARFIKATGQSKTPLSDAELRLVPADATSAFLVKFDPGAGVRQMREMVEQAEPFADALRQAKEVTGVDVIEDVMASIGGVMGAYMSESTGGGGLGSGVVILQLTNPAKFQAALGKLAAKCNELMAEKGDGAKGRIAVRDWSEGGQSLTSLQFPGLPIPLEITWGVAGEWFVIAFNPQAALGAMRQATGQGDGGLMSNRAVAGLFPGDKKFQSVAFLDTPRALKSGYGMLTMLGAGLSNLVRTPKGPDDSREVVLIVPAYKELAAGVRPSVSFSYWDGENLINETHGNRSILVEAGGTLGVVKEFAPFIGAGVAALTAAKRQGMSDFMRRRDNEPPHEDRVAPQPVKPTKPNFRLLPAGAAPASAVVQGEPGC